MVFKGNEQYGIDTIKVINKLIDIWFSKRKIAALLWVQPIYIYRWHKWKNNPTEYYWRLFWIIADIAKECKQADYRLWCADITAKFRHYLSTPVAHIAKTKHAEYRDTRPDSVYARHRKELMEATPYCQLCGTTTRGLECHHIYFRSEVMNNKYKHSKRNLIILCVECHDLMESKKWIRELLIKDRKLDLLFKLDYAWENPI